MSQTISRRAVLSATGRAAVATLALGGVSVAATDPTADAELLRLEAVFRAAEQRWSASIDEENEAEDEFSRLHPLPDWPNHVLPPELEEEFGNIRAGDHDLMMKFVPDHPYCRSYRAYELETADARKAYYAARDARREDEERRPSLTCPAHKEAEALAYKILATPAVTPAGVLIKLRLSDWFEDYEPGMERMRHAIIADLEMMTGGQANG